MLRISLIFKNSRILRIKNAKFFRREIFKSALEYLQCVKIKVKVLLSFKMNSKQFCSFDNFNSLLWGDYSFGFWLLLTLKLTMRIIGRGDMVGGS